MCYVKPMKFIDNRQQLSDVKCNITNWQRPPSTLGDGQQATARNQLHRKGPPIFIYKPFVDYRNSWTKQHQTKNIEFSSDGLSSIKPHIFLSNSSVSLQVIHKVNDSSWAAVKSLVNESTQTKYTQISSWTKQSEMCRLNVYCGPKAKGDAQKQKIQSMSESLTCTLPGWIDTLANV